MFAHAMSSTNPTAPARTSRAGLIRSVASSSSDLALTDQRSL
jgi:hypothetical protein